MRRTNQLNPMRSMILLAVTWVAGTLLFAAERTPAPSTATRTAALTQAAPEPADGGASPAAPETPSTSGGEAETSEASAQTEASAQPDEGVDEPAEAALETNDSDDDSKASDSSQRATAADTKGAKGSPQRFVPSEQVRADFDVSFPIDI